MKGKIFTFDKSCKTLAPDPHISILTHLSDQHLLPAPTYLCVSQIQPAAAHAPAPTSLYLFRHTLPWTSAWLTPSLPSTQLIFPGRTSLRTLFKIIGSSMLPVSSCLFYFLTKALITPEKLQRSFVSFWGLHCSLHHG